MHDEPDVIGVQPGESALTSEILHDDFHHGDILVFKKSERKKPLHLIYVPRFDIRLIVVFSRSWALYHFCPTFGILMASEMMEGENVNVT